MNNLPFAQQRWCGAAGATAVKTLSDYRGNFGETYGVLIKGLNLLARCIFVIDETALQSLPRKKLNSGSSEIRMWITVGGAVEHLDLSWSHYVPGYRTPAGSGTGLGFAVFQ